MNISAFLLRIGKSSQGVGEFKGEAEAQEKKPDPKSRVDVVEVGPKFSGGKSIAVEAAPELPSRVDQKTTEAIAERDRVLKTLAEAKILARKAKEERDREYPGEPMLYFLEKLAPTLADAGSSWERNVHIPLGVKEKK